VLRLDAAPQAGASRPDARLKPGLLPGARHAGARIASR
jgi:hypothetical protein